MTKSSLRTQSVLWLLLTGALIPWFFIRIQQAMNSDILWLCEALHRWLGGCNLSECAYETNPPLSLLMYLLPVLGHDWLGIPLQYSVFMQSCIIVMASACAVYKILSVWGKLDFNAIFIIVAAYILANTVGASLYFGERDHLIGVVLMPFVLMQLTLTFGLPQAERIKWPLFLTGALFILIKPHYGLIPSLLLLHRLILRRNLTVLKDADFLSLALLTPLYIAFVWLIFPDYGRVILPDVLTLYLPDDRWKNIGEFLLIGGLCSMTTAMTAAFMTCPAPVRRISFFLIAASVLGLIPYAVQGLGYYYHTLPAYSFLWPAVALVVTYSLASAAREEIAVVLTTALLILFAFSYAPLNTRFPDHADYARLPLTKLLDKYCENKKPCSFFMFNLDMGIVHETAYYSGFSHASRFPSLWFLPKLVRFGKLAKQEKGEIFEKYADLMAEDISRNKPEVMVIWHPDKGYYNFDFVKFFSSNTAYAKEWGHYRKESRITLSYGDYFPDTAKKNEIRTYDVYRRVSP